jgi:hypothetical protein
MRRLISSTTALLLVLSVPAYAPGQVQKTAPAESPIEVQISGPKLIRVGENLHFKVTLVHRSAAPIALTFWHDGWATAILTGRLRTRRTACSRHRPQLDRSKFSA